jgi:hypothetical protein
LLGSLLRDVGTFLFWVSGSATPKPKFLFAVEVHPNFTITAEPTSKKKKDINSLSLEQIIDIFAINGEFIANLFLTSF